MLIRIRRNDGDVVPGLLSTKKPGSIIYESVPVPIGVVLDIQNPDVLSPGYATVVLSGDDIAAVGLDSRGTLTVQVMDLNLGQQFGILTRNPPDIGQSANDLWVSNRNGEWRLEAIEGDSGNFAMTIVAVPEPGTVLLFALGGVALFWMRRRA